MEMGSGMNLKGVLDFVLTGNVTPNQTTPNGN